MVTAIFISIVVVLDPAHAVYVVDVAVYIFFAINAVVAVSLVGSVIFIVLDVASLMLLSCLSLSTILSP